MHYQEESDDAAVLVCRSDCPTSVTAMFETLGCTGDCNASIMALVTQGESCSSALSDSGCSLVDPEPGIPSPELGVLLQCQKEASSYAERQS